jgi:hypothetical protein
MRAARSARPAVSASLLSGASFAKAGKNSGMENGDATANADAVSRMFGSTWNSGSASAR